MTAANHARTQQSAIALCNNLVARADRFGLKLQSLPTQYAAPSDWQIICSMFTGAGLSHKEKHPIERPDHSLVMRVSLINHISFKVKRAGSNNEDVIFTGAQILTYLHIIELGSHTTGGMLIRNATAYRLATLYADLIHAGIRVFMSKCLDVGVWKSFLSPEYSEAVITCERHPTIDRRELLGAQTSATAWMYLHFERHPLTHVGCSDILCRGAKNARWALQEHTNSRSHLMRRLKGKPVARIQPKLP